jgi:hypothetical protein
MALENVFACYDYEVKAIHVVSRFGTVWRPGEVVQNCPVVLGACHVVPFVLKPFVRELIAFFCFVPASLKPPWVEIWWILIAKAHTLEVFSFTTVT